MTQGNKKPPVATAASNKASYDPIVTQWDAIDQFRDAIVAAGLVPPREIVADGKLRRFSPTGKRGDDAAWYVLHGDGVPAGAFGDWRSGVWETWRADVGRPLSPEEDAAHRRRIEEARRQAEEERRRRAEHAARLAAIVWRAALPAQSDHPYLERKRVARTATLRELPVGELAMFIGYTPQAKGEPLQGRVLVAPVRINNQIATVEMIDEFGRKSALAGGVKKGGYWATASLPDRGRVVIAEGIATALSIAEALGEPVAAALSVGNLAAAGEAIRAEHPNVELVIAADLDKATGLAHPEAVKAAEALGCALVAPPRDLLPGTDFNDLAVRDGLDAVRACFEAAPTLTASDAVRLVENALMPDTLGVSEPYPIDALGPLSAAARALADGVQCHPAMAGQSILAAAALLVQGIANVRVVSGQIKPSSLYCLTLAGSGEGKDTCDGIALHPIEEWQRQAVAQFERERRNADKDAPPMLEPYRKLKDATVEGLRQAFQNGRSSQGIFSTEAGVMLAGHALTPENKVKTATALCDLWDKGHLSVARATTGRFERYGVRLAMHLLVQPVSAFEAVQDERLAGSGFWPRFLVAAPAEIEPRKFKPFDPSRDPAIAAFWARCRELLAYPAVADNDTLPVLELDNGALAVARDVFEHFEHEARRGNLRAIKPFALRATEIAVRVAGVIAAFAGHDVIARDVFEGAVELVRYSLKTWQTLLEGKSGVHPEATRAVALYRWLLQKGGAVRLVEILRTGPSSLRSKGRRDAALETLLEFGVVAVEGDQVRALIPHHLLTPANLANPAKTRATTVKATIANGCDFCESDGDDSGNRKIRNRSQIAESQALQAKSQKSQESQGVASQLNDDEEVRL